MTRLASHAQSHRVPDSLLARVNGPVARWLPAVGVGVLGVALMIEVVRTAPPDAPVVAATFDVAPAT